MMGTGKPKVKILLLSGILLLLCIIRISLLPVAAPAGEHQTHQPGHYDYEGDVHFHTKYEKPGDEAYEKIAVITNQQHVDFMISTDRNNLNAFFDHKEGWYGNTLFLVGVEISRPEGYLLGLNLHEYPITREWPTDKVLAEIARQNGIALVAHPSSPRWRWQMQDDPRTAGQEILNLTDQFNSASPDAMLISALYYPFNTPAAFMELYHYPAEALKIWDEKTAKHPFTGVFAPDFHPDFHQRLFPLKKDIFISFPNAEDMIPVGHNHIILQNPFAHTLQDKKMIYDAIRQGHLYVAMDMLQDATGFFFSAKQGGKTVWMGDTLPAARETEFSVSLPPTVSLKNIMIHVYQNGKEISQSRESPYKFKAKTPGAYRVEVEAEIPTFWGFGREVTWIYSNPIYLR